MTDKQLKNIEDLIQLFEEAIHCFASSKEDKGLNLLKMGRQAENRIDKAYAAFFESEIAHVKGDRQGRRERQTGYFKKGSNH